MPDESSGQQPARDVQQGPSSGKQGIVAQDGNNNSSDNGTATANLTKDVHWITHATFWSQVGLGVIGLLALWIYHGQLTEMKKATRASAQAADAAASAATTAKDALVIGNRPWMKVDLVQTAPLEFLPDGSAKIGIKEKIENVGSSVALHVKSWFDIVPLGRTSNAFIDAKVRQEAGCNSIETATKTPILDGEEMFPHDPMLYFFAGAIPKDHIAPIKEDVPEMDGKAGQVGFILVGCVTYRSSFEGPGIPNHETFFEYWIAKQVKRGGVSPFLDPFGSHPDYSIMRLQNGVTAN